MILFCQSQSKLTEKWEKNLTRAWPEPNFSNPSWDPTRVRSHNLKPDLKPEKRTRPIPSLGCIFFGILDYKKNLMKLSKILFWSAYDTNLCISLFAASNMKMHSISMLLLNSFLFHYWIIEWNRYIEKCTFLVGMGNTRMCRIPILLCKSSRRRCSLHSEILFKS